jgi:putative addiction module CopG family antidote
MDALRLPAELEHFAAEAIASGRYRDMSEVITAGLSLLRRAEAARAAFNASPSTKSTKRSTTSSMSWTAPTRDAPGHSDATGAG